MQRTLAMGTRLGWRNLVLVLPILAASCGRFGWRSEHELDQTIPIPEGVRTVSFRILDGDVTVVGSDRSDVHITGRCLLASDNEQQFALLDAIEPGFSVRGVSDGTLVIEGAQFPSTVDRTLNVIAVRVTIEVPQGMECDLVAEERGRLGVSHVSGGVRLQNREGDLRLSHCSGPTVLQSRHSNVLVDGHAGPLEVKLTSGNISVFASQLVEPGFDLASEEGNIHCLIPADSRVRIDGETGLGRASNGFDVPVEELAHSARRMVGGEGVTIRMRTASGGISVGTRRD